MNILTDGLIKLGYDIKMPFGTFYLWMKIDEDCENFAMRLLNNGVVVTPGSGFGTSGNKYVRFSITLSDANLLKGLNKIPENTS